MKFSFVRGKAVKHCSNSPAAVVEVTGGLQQQFGLGCLCARRDADTVWPFLGPEGWAVGPVASASFFAFL